MDIPITPRTRALILRYEHDRLVDDSLARDAVKQGGAESDRDVASMVLHPYDPATNIRQRPERDWAWAFLENERFADALLKKERECDVPDLHIHLFGCAPLVLLLHLGWCLSRRPLTVYQQEKATGAWSLGYSRAQPSTSEPFFQIEGLPTQKQGGRGHVALIIEVTNPIADIARAEFESRHPSEILSTVRMWPARGIGKKSVQHPGDIASAVDQLRDVLDTLHERRTGAESVLLAMDCPGSMATAFGSAINPHTQHPLWLHQYDADPASKRRYTPVHQLRHQRRPASTPATDLTNAQWSEVLEVLREVTRVHTELVEWLSQPKQKPLIARLGGTALLESKIHDIPATDESTLSFRHLQGRWSFEIGLLRRFQALRTRLERSEWDECVRLFLLHEAYHVQQEGPNSYDYRGIGATGWVLESVDYDADVVSMELALDWRNKGRARPASGKEKVQSMEAIIWNALESVRIFEPEWPVRELSERRLRRYVIWLFHACRLGLRQSKQDPQAKLDRVVLEFTGLPTVPDSHETYHQHSVRLEELDKASGFGLAFYFRHKLTRDTDTAWIRELLLAISRWEDQRRDKSQDKVRQLFELLFNRHPALLTPSEP